MLNIVYFCIFFNQNKASFFRGENMIFLRFQLIDIYNEKKCVL